jgi:hypothetical protein
MNCEPAAPNPERKHELFGSSGAAFPMIKEGMSAEIRPTQPAGTVHTATVTLRRPRA